MDFSISAIAASLLFSTIGILLLKEAKRRSNLKLIPIAILLMGYTYFTSNPWMDWGVGFALCALAYHLWEY